MWNVLNLYLVHRFEHIAILSSGKVFSVSPLLSFFLSVAWRGYLARQHVKQLRQQDRNNAAVQIQSGNDDRKAFLLVLRKIVSKLCGSSYNTLNNKFFKLGYFYKVLLFNK